MLNLYALKLFTVCVSPLKYLVSDTAPILLIWKLKLDVIKDNTIVQNTNVEVFTIFKTKSLDTDNVVKL